jgi:hypothetical protein
MNDRVLHLHIDRIVVEGVPASGQQKFVRALEGRTTEWAEVGVPLGLLAQARQRIAAVKAGQLRRGASPDQVAGTDRAPVASGG